MGKSWLLGGPGVLLLLLLCIFPGDTSTSTTEPQYLVLVPVLIHTETSEKICVQLSNLNESVTLSITLQFDFQNKSLINNVVSDQDVFQCIPFQLPKVNDSSGTTQVFLTVTVEGQTLRYWSRKRVLVKNLESLVFVQTDKPIYKPAQLVQFRIVALDEDFHPVNEKFPLVYIQDQKRNRLLQWQDVQLDVGLIQLSFQLAEEPRLGTYKVVVQKDSGQIIEHSFDAEEYVLPTFEVSVQAPKKISVMTEEIEVTGCAKYTYGKSVPGEMKISICRPFSTYRSQCFGRDSQAACEDFIGNADVHGCFTQLVKTKVFQLKRDGYMLNLEVEATIKEEGTGVEQTSKVSIDITPILSIATFENADRYYKPGIPFTGQVKLVDGIEKPIANETIEVRIDAIGYAVNYTTNGQGIAQFSIDTANFTDDRVHIRAVYKMGVQCHDRMWHAPSHEAASKTLTRFFSLNENYIHIEPISGTLSCGRPYLIQVYYILNQNITKGKKVVFHYLFAAKGGIVRGGTHVLAENHEDKGEFFLDLAVDKEIAPFARLLLYAILSNGDLLVDSMEFDIEKCFLNKVNLHFSEPEALPASEIQLHLEASKGSLCAIHAVDQSVFILKPEAELSPKTVYDLLPVKDQKGYYYQHWNLEDPDLIACVPPKKITIDGIHYRPDSYPSDEIDAYGIIKDFGMIVFTSTKIHKPVSCVAERRLYYETAEAVAFSSPVANRMLARRPGGASRLADYSDESDSDVQPQETTRHFFPETWMWDLKVVPADSPQGEIAIPVTVPDTITEWRTGAFCLSTNTGFGLAKSIALKAFQPYFLDFTLPYSVVRGEEFTLKVTVFTYLQRCIQVKITLEHSSDFIAAPVEEEKELYCLCPNERKTVAWLVTPKSLGTLNFTASAESVTSEQLCGNEIVEQVTRGQKDTVIKTLIVEPEGIEKEVVISNLYCSDKEKKDIQGSVISLKLPENIVEGSARASFCALGDILSNAIQNLHKLLQLPCGCGEQNVALFAPNVFVMDYLNATEQLTEVIKSKATGYLVAGYQRQLNYKHSDGSYSTFGEHGHEPGNSWLTAFVLKAFARSKNYIFVEQHHITDAQAWLAVRQKENGCFRSTGTLFNNALKGGVDDELTHSAYVTICLLESSLPVTHTTVRNALFCLETAAKAKKIHIYAQALLAYAFALAGKNDLRDEMLHRLDEVAVKDEDGSIHWEQPGKEKENFDYHFYKNLAPSSEVETNAYILLAYLKKMPAPSHDDLTKATSMVQWITKQQNPYGGFSSTQDTVLAIQGLSVYGAHMFSRGSTGSQVSLISEGNTLRQFQVDDAHRLLLQCQSLPKVPGDYNIEVSGEGCVHTQTTLKYNVQPHGEEAPFTLKVHTVPETCTGPKAHETFDIAINVSYVGKRSDSNMVIVDVKLPSGHVAVKSSVKKLQELNKVKRTEVNTGHVLLYLEKVTNATQSFSFTVERDVPVQGLKPAVVNVYDYYKTDEFAVTNYNAPCKKE